MWKQIKAFFFDSETIFWARMQAFFGAIAILLTYTDTQLFISLLPANWEVWFLFVNGIATEYLRRRRSDL
jgi:hypothetical protein